MRRTAFLAFVALMLAACGQVEMSSEPAPADQAPSASATATEEEAGEFCAEVGRRVSAADCEVYEQLAESATRGMAAFNAPDPMRRGETHMLQLAVSFAPPEQPQPAPPGAAATDPSQGASTGSGSGDDRGGLSREQSDPPAPPSPPATPGDTVEDLPGQTVEFEPLVGRFMRAELSGVGFQITPRSPASQEVTPDSVTTWNWEVVAQQGGARSLTLTTVVEGCTGDGSECVPLRSTTQNYTVNVEVGPIDQVRDFIGGIPGWLQAIAAVLTALAGLIAAWFGLRNAVKRGRSEN